MADDGTKYLPISDAMGRDIDSGRAKDRDIADFLPDEVAQEIYDQSHPGPVHAENLIPISKAEAAERTRFDGESLPAFPSTRRVIPAPFRRDRISGGSHGKVWMFVLGHQVRKGDIITDVGLVTDVREELRHEKIADELLPGVNPELGDQVATGRDFVVTGAGGTVRTYDGNAEVRVFRIK